MVGGLATPIHGTPHPAHPGGTLEESERLLDELWKYATLPSNCYTHQWRVGDLLVWDNRSTMHRRDPFDADSRRIMHRTQIKGRVTPRPFYS